MNNILLHFPVDCGFNEFRCRLGLQCINASFACDGTIQCDDFSDETNCGKYGAITIIVLTE